MAQQEVLYFMYGNNKIAVLFNYITNTPDGSPHVMLGRYRPTSHKPPMVSNFDDFISLNYDEFVSDINEYLNIWEEIDPSYGMPFKRTIHNDVQPLLVKAGNHIKKYGRIKDNDLYYLIDTYMLLNASIEEEYEHRTRHDLEYYQNLYLKCFEAVSKVYFNYLWVIDPNTQQPVKLSSLVGR